MSLNCCLVSRKLKTSLLQPLFTKCSFVLQKMKVKFSTSGFFGPKWQNVSFRMHTGRGRYRRHAKSRTIIKIISPPSIMLSNHFSSVCMSRQLRGLKQRIKMRQSLLITFNDENIVVIKYMAFARKAFSVEEFKILI